jgi:type I restriction enzyme S subunit
VMHDLFTRGVTHDGHLRPTRAEAPDLYKQSSVGWIPLEWRTAIVRECGSVQLGRQRSPVHMSGRWTTPYLRVANVFDGSSTIRTFLPWTSRLMNGGRSRSNRETSC